MQCYCGTGIREGVSKHVLRHRVRGDSAFMKTDGIKISNAVYSLCFTEEEIKEH